MDYTKMTRVQLINELETLRKQVTEIQKVKTERKRAEQALRESEEQHRTLLENLPQKIFLKDRSLVYISCNENYARDLGIEGREIAGRTDYDFYPRGLADKYRADDKRIMDAGKTETLEEKYIQNGREVMVQTVKTVVRDKSGNVTGILGIFWDITEHKRAEEALRESEVYLRTIFQNSPVGMLIIDSQTHKIADVNPAAVKMIGVEKENVIGSICHRFVCPAEIGKCPVSDLGQTVDNSERKMLKASGEEVPIIKTVVPITLGGHPCFLETLFDITDRKKAEERLKESEERFRAIFDNAVDGLLLADTADRTFRGANRMMRQMLGYSPEELDKLRIDDIHPNEALPYVIGEFEKQNRGETLVAKDIPVKRKDGTVFYADVSGSHMTLAGKKYLLGIFRDITERKKAEEALRRLEAEKMVVKELRELDRMKNEFVETVTHELRTPMTPLKSTLEMFVDGTLGEITPQQREYVEMMSRNVERLSRFATDILSLSRLDSGAYALRPQEISMFSVVRPSIDLLKKRAEKKNISLSLVVRTEVFAFADPDAVSEVITNLVNNAVVHCPEGTQVTISSRFLGEGFVEVSVADNGPGIPQNMVEKIFDRFFQAKRTRGPGYRGAGIGLSICKSLVEKMGGKISVESEPGKGAIFRFTLPTRKLAES